MDASWAWNEEAEETENTYLLPAPSPGTWSRSSRPATAYSLMGLSGPGPAACVRDPGQEWAPGEASMCPRLR